MNHLETKNEGNKNYINEEYELAIKCYTEAIKLCPKDLKKDISICYQNRAASYDKLVIKTYRYLFISSFLVIKYNRFRIKITYKTSEP